MKPVILLVMLAATWVMPEAVEASKQVSNSKDVNDSVWSLHYKW